MNGDILVIATTAERVVVTLQVSTDTDAGRAVGW